jgi:hypothetical protein
MSTMVRRAMSSRMATLRKLTERACNDPQRMRARKTEAKIIEMMPLRAWLSCTAVSRLIGAPDDRKIRARLDRLARDGKIERKRAQGSHGPVYLFRRLSRATPRRSTVTAL